MVVLWQKLSTWNSPLNVFVSQWLEGLLIQNWQNTTEHYGFNIKTAWTHLGCLELRQEPLFKMIFLFAIGILEILMNMILDKHQSAFGERTPKQQIRDSISIQQAVGAYFWINSRYQIGICFLGSQSLPCEVTSDTHACRGSRMWLDWNATHFFCLQVSYCWWRCCLLIEQIYISYWCPLLPPGTNHKM